MGYVGVVLMGVVSIVIVSKIWEVFKVVVWRPYWLTKTFEKQGIRGPTYKLLYGSLKEIKKLKKLARDAVLDTDSNIDITPRVLPHYHKWSSEYGQFSSYTSFFCFFPHF